MPTKHLITLSLATIGLAAGEANAATITWQTPVSVSGDGTADIDNTGTLEYAYQYGAFSGALTIDGVTFADVSDTTASGGTNFTTAVDAGQQGDIGEVAGTTGDYQTLLRQNTYEANNQTPWTLQGLTNGQDYLVQFWVADIRYDDTQVQTIAGGANTTEDISIKTGQYVIGTFTADATTQQVSFSGDILNAMQLRSVPEPSTAALLAGCLGLGHVMMRRRRR